MPPQVSAPWDQDCSPEGVVSDAVPHLALCLQPGLRGPSSYLHHRPSVFYPRGASQCWVYIVPSATGPLLLCTDSPLSPDRCDSTAPAATRCKVGQGTGKAQSRAEGLCDSM